MNTNLQTTWANYTAAWNTSDVEEMKALFSKCLDADCIYRDPIATAAGWEELSGYIAQVHGSIPGVQLVTRDFKSHNGRCIVHWDLCGADGSVMSEGVSYGEFNESGKLTVMAGFFDLPPQG